MSFRILCLSIVLWVLQWMYNVLCACVGIVHTYITSAHENMKRRSSNEKRCGYVSHGIESYHKFMSFWHVFYLRSLMEHF